MGVDIFRGGRGGEGRGGRREVTGEGRETTQAWSLGYSEIIILSGIDRVPPDHTDQIF